MEWISVKDRLPTETGKYYLVMSYSYCENCNNNEDHSHRLDYIKYDYSVARWSKKDLYLVEYYRSKGDNSWDHYSYDRFTECKFTNDEITHWMSFPNDIN